MKTMAFLISLSSPPGTPLQLLEVNSEQMDLMLSEVTWSLRAQVFLQFAKKLLVAAEFTYQ